MQAIPRYKDHFRDIATGVIIHNAGRAYNQQVFDVPFAEVITKLPRSVIETNMHRSGVYPFVVGGRYASWINTVSEKYADKIMHDPAEDERTDGIGTKLMRLSGQRPSCEACCQAERFAQHRRPVASRNRASMPASRRFWHAGAYGSFTGTADCWLVYRMQHDESHSAALILMAQANLLVKRLRIGMVVTLASVAF